MSSAIQVSYSTQSDRIKIERTQYITARHLPASIIYCPSPRNSVIRCFPYEICHLRRTGPLPIGTFVGKTSLSCRDSDTPGGRARQFFMTFFPLLRFSLWPCYCCVC